MEGEYYIIEDENLNKYETQEAVIDRYIRGM